MTPCVELFGEAIKAGKIKLAALDDPDVEPLWEEISQPGTAC